MHIYLTHLYTFTQLTLIWIALANRELVFIVDGVLIEFEILKKNAIRVFKIDFYVAFYLLTPSVKYDYTPKTPVLSLSNQVFDG